MYSGGGDGIRMLLIRNPMIRHVLCMLLLQHARVDDQQHDSQLHFMTGIYV